MSCFIGGDEKDGLSKKVIGCVIRKMENWGRVEIRWGRERKIKFLVAVKRHPHVI